ncbi:MAG: DNA pilot protein [Microviridae sp.]|nr:MAG: DNA pilot protein [Microviridae sp.]
MVWPAIIAAAASIAGGIMGNKAAAKEAEKNRDFQEEMSGTAYQRAVTDMKAAGINPMLASKLGGASTPSGSQAQQSDVVTPAVNSGMAAYRAGLETKQIEANVAKTNADTVKSQADTDFIKAETVKSAKSAGLVEAQTTHSQASAKQAEAQSRVLEVTVDKVLADTAHIKSDRARVEAAEKELLERLKKYPLERQQVEVAIQKLREEVYGAGLHNARGEVALKSDQEELKQLEYEGWGKYRHYQANKGDYGEYRPYLHDLTGITNSARNLGSLFRGRR